MGSNSAGSLDGEVICCCALLITVLYIRTVPSNVRDAMSKPCSARGRVSAIDMGVLARSCK